MIIAPATSADIEELCSLVNAAYRGHGSRPGWTHEIELIEGKRADPASLAPMLEQNIAVLLLRTSTRDKLTGCVAVQPQVDSTWYISMLAIDPEQQAAGFGRTLLNAAESYAAERGAALARMTVIQVRESLIAWYERCGYRRTGETEPFPYENQSVGKALRADLHFVILEKALSAEQQTRQAMQPISETLPMSSEPVTVSAAELEQHSHRIFRQYRPVTPLIKKDDGIYIAIRARDVEALTTDPRTRQLETEIARSRGVKDGPLLQFLQNTMLLSNAPAHRPRRTPLAQAFAFKFITGLRPRVRAIADEIIDRCYDRGEMDFIAEYAAWLPARVICLILGVPEADIPDFTRRVYSLARALSSSFSREDVPELQKVAGELIGYVHDLLHNRRMNPQDDFLTSYDIALEQSQTLSHSEALIQIVTVLLAGSDTTRGALAIQTSLLLEHRKQWDAVCRDSSLIPGAVLECLRYEPSVGSFARVTLEDITLDGFLLPRNSVVALSTLSAMRDPALYADPDTFDIKRSDHPRRHLVFGGGVHRCLGETLARVELEEGLAAVTARLPDLELEGGPVTMQGGGAIRSVKDMRVRWRRAP